MEVGDRDIDRIYHSSNILDTERLSHTYKCIGFPMFARPEVYYVLVL
jgi:hypothetical protein